ncbi:unnamed protein product [Musa textilis]
MPCDVHCALWGPPCRDVARHFVQCWNYAKRSKASNEQAIPLLMPQHNMVIPHYMGKKRKMNVPNNEQNNNHKDLKKFGTLILSRHPAVVTTRTRWTSSSKWKCRQ